MPSRQTETAPLRWTVHPAGQDRRRACIVTLVVLLAGTLAWVVSRSLPVTVAGVGLLLLSLAPFFLPRTYELDARGASESGPLLRTRRLGWDQVRSVKREFHGVHLSPLHRPSRWTVDRGLFLRTTGNTELVARYALDHRCEASPS
ncbi:MAG: hypothetical protein ACT4PU_10510 [Planctomycetota bacterium]